MKNRELREKQNKLKGGGGGEGSRNWGFLGGIGVGSETTKKKKLLTSVRKSFQLPFSWSNVYKN